MTSSKNCASKKSGFDEQMNKGQGIKCSYYVLSIHFLYLFIICIATKLEVAHVWLNYWCEPCRNVMYYFIEFLSE